MQANMWPRVPREIWKKTRSSGKKKYVVKRSTRRDGTAGLRRRPETDPVCKKKEKKKKTLGVGPDPF